MRLPLFLFPLVRLGDATINLRVSSSGGNKTSGLQYGIMFEDINNSGDGGIYAELVRNRAFQGGSVFPSTIDPWVGVGGASLTLANLSMPLSSALPTSLRVTAPTGNGSSTGVPVGISNPGYWGIDVKPQTYSGSFHVSGAYTGSFTAALVSDTSGETLASTTIPALPSQLSGAGAWTKFNYTLTPTRAAANVNNSLQITFDPSATNGSALDFNLISLFPPTYNDRPNGLRADLMEALKGLNPSFLRMPGGNNLEGESAPYFWKWNESIGPLEDRPGFPGTWTYENTMGLGLVEYLYWCIDLDMEPILAVWSGLYLDETVIPEDDIGAYVQYALDELDFIMGDTSTEYGALREKLGYGSAPLYDIKYVEVGNEDNLNNGNASYWAYRFPAFYAGLTAAWPNLTVLASAVGPVNTSTGVVIPQDYHDYARPDYFVSQFSYLDHVPRSRPRLLGEYATVQPNAAGTDDVEWDAEKMAYPFWIGSVAEAVFLLGAERNADAVLGASYAPTLQNLDSVQWTPDLVSFSADTGPNGTVLSTSYHVVRLLSGTRIAETLPVTGAAATGSAGSGFGPAYWVAGTAENTNLSYVFKAAVYNASGDVGFSVAFPGVVSGAAASLTVLTAPDGYSWNMPGAANVVSETASRVVVGGNGTLAFSMPNLSVAVLTI